MDVSAINAVSPRNIDWRKLTARQIIKYDTQGVEVPTPYLQWAKEFINDVTANDKDTTTYEMASGLGKKPAQKSNISRANEDNSQENPDFSKGKYPREQTALEQRKDMEQAGMSLSEIGKVFKAESDKKAEDSQGSASTSQAAQVNSNAEIEALENYMQDITSKMKDVKAQVNNQANKSNVIGKIAELNTKLQELGAEGQSLIAQKDSGLTQYQVILEDQTSINLSTIDFGNATVEIGKSLANAHDKSGDSLIHQGILTKNSGNNAIDEADKSQQIQMNALQTNGTNMSRVLEYTDTVTENSGAKSVPVKKEEPKQQTSDKLPNKETEKKKEEEKGIQASQNDGTDKTDKRNTNLDEILKAKIRRGQKIDT